MPPCGVHAVLPASGVGGARRHGDLGEREGVRGQSRRQGHRGWLQRRQGTQSDRSHQSERNHCCVEQILWSSSLQRHRLDGRSHFFHLQVLFCCSVYRAMIRFVIFSPGDFL